MRAERIARAIILLLTVTLGACAAPAASLHRALHPARPVRIVVLGDSLGLGTGASGPAGGFAFDLYRRIVRERPGSSIRTYAIGGARISDVLRLEIPRLAHERFDLVLLVVGGNDVIRGTPPLQFASRYRQTLDAVVTAEPHAAIVACGVPDVAISPIFSGGDVETIASLSRRDDRAVRRAAARHTIPVIDLYTLSRRARGERDTFLSADRFHPSDLGYRQIADAAYPTVKRALRATN